MLPTEQKKDELLVVRVWWLTELGSAATLGAGWCRELQTPPMRCSGGASAGGGTNNF